MSIKVKDNWGRKIVFADDTKLEAGTWVKDINGDSYYLTCAAMSYCEDENCAVCSYNNREELWAKDYEQYFCDRVAEIEFRH